MADNKTTELRAGAKDRDVPAKRSWERPILRKESIASMTRKSKKQTDGQRGTS